MGYLPSDTNEIVIDAVLTKYGRQKLASQGALGISKFALSDDEIDYSLYNVNIPAGAEFYDTAIRYLPVLEAVSANADAMRYKLFTNATPLIQNEISLAVGGDGYLLGTSTWSDGTTGVTDHSVYDIRIKLQSTTFLPANILSSVYYVATLSANEGSLINDVYFEGVKVNASLSQDTLNAITAAGNQVNAINAALGPNSTQKQAVGMYFQFAVNATTAILRPTSFNVRIQAAGPINVQPIEFVIYVNSMSAIQSIS